MTNADWFALSIQVAPTVAAAVAAIFAAVSARGLKEELDCEARVASARIEPPTCGFARGGEGI